MIETAELLVGGARHLAMVPPALVSPGAERLIWRRPLADTLGDIAARRGRRVAVLASGDPLWYGVGAVLARHFPLDEMTIVPHPGAFSLAAARLGWAIAECTALSLHGRPLDGSAAASGAARPASAAVAGRRYAAPASPRCFPPPAGGRAG